MEMHGRDTFHLPRNQLRRRTANTNRASPDVAGRENDTVSASSCRYGEDLWIWQVYDANTYELASVSIGSHTTEYFWAAGRLTNVLVSSVPLCGNFSYSYVPNSDLLETTTYLNGTITVSRTYDPLQRLTNITSVSSVPSVVNWRGSVLVS